MIHSARIYSLSILTLTLQTQEREMCTTQKQESVLAAAPHERREYDLFQMCVWSSVLSARLGNG